MALHNRIIQEVRNLNRERLWFGRRFPPTPQGSGSNGAPDCNLPTMTWEQLSRQLEDLAAEQANLPALRRELDTLRRRAPLMAPELVLRTLLVLAASVMEERSPEAQDGEADDTAGREDSSML